MSFELSRYSIRTTLIRVFARPNVHIKDVAELFMVVYDLALAGNKGNHGRQGYFFAESGEHTL